MFLQLNSTIQLYVILIILHRRAIDRHMQLCYMMLYITYVIICYLWCVRTVRLFHINAKISPPCIEPSVAYVYTYIYIYSKASVNFIDEYASWLLFCIIIDYSYCILLRDHVLEGPFVPIIFFLLIWIGWTLYYFAVGCITTIHQVFWGIILCNFVSRILWCIILCNFVSRILCNFISRILCNFISRILCNFVSIILCSFVSIILCSFISRVLCSFT